MSHVSLGDHRHMILLYLTQIMARFILQGLSPALRPKDDVMVGSNGWYEQHAAPCSTLGKEQQVKHQQLWQKQRQLMLLRW